MSTIAAIVERIRREDPVAAQIAEECKKGILEKSEPAYPQGDYFYVYLRFGLPDRNSCPDNSPVRARVLLADMMPDIEILGFDNSVVVELNSDRALVVNLTFRQREGSKP